MDKLDIATNAFEQIVGYYRRSHKHGENTCYMMYLEAERALREMSLLAQRAADGLKTRENQQPDQVFLSKST